MRSTATTPARWASKYATAENVRAAQERIAREAAEREQRQQDAEARAAAQERYRQQRAALWRQRVSTATERGACLICLRASRWETTPAVPAAPAGGLAHRDGVSHAARPRRLATGTPEQAAISPNDDPTTTRRPPEMRTIRVDDEVYDLVTGYAQLWNKTHGQAVGTLVRLHEQPEHTVTAPTATSVEAGGDNSGEVRW